VAFGDGQVCDVSCRKVNEKVKETHKEAEENKISNPRAIGRRYATQNRAVLSREGIA